MKAAATTAGRCAIRSIRRRCGRRQATVRRPIGNQRRRTVSAAPTETLRSHRMTRDTARSECGGSRATSKVRRDASDQYNEKKYNFGVEDKESVEDRFKH